MMQSVIHHHVLSARIQVYARLTVEVIKIKSVLVPVYTDLNIACMN